jgi:hypothetical protein
MQHFLIPIAGWKISTNKSYAGIHWAKRKEYKDGIFGLANVFCRPIRKVESYPVQISYRFFFVSKPLDVIKLHPKKKKAPIRSTGAQVDQENEDHVEIIIKKYANNAKNKLG